jgi:16S rRNA (adenine1518-N6/adenine1519-N6)-dimethyltransferase
MAGAERRVPGSKEAVRAALDALGLSPHKRFGQNFVADRAVLERIVDRSGAGPASVVLEVGPGLGTLTSVLLARVAVVVAVEIDHGLARNLREVFAGEPRFVLVEGDVMAGKGRLADEAATAVLDAVSRAGAPGFDVVSNLPYGISSSFLAALASPPGPPLSATVMLQAEVADVLLARPSTESYSALTAFVRTYFEVRRELEVGRHVFFPQPDVDSTVVRLLPKAGTVPPPGPFGAFLQALFQSRRKAIGTTLRGLLPPGTPPARAWLATAGFDAGARVESLAPERIAELFALVERDRGPLPPSADNLSSA